MEKRFLTFCLFACLTCSAQLPVVPMVLRSVSSATLPAGLLVVYDSQATIGSSGTTGIATNGFGFVTNWANTAPGTPDVNFTLNSITNLLPAAVASTNPVYRVSKGGTNNTLPVIDFSFSNGNPANFGGSALSHKYTTNISQPYTTVMVFQCTNLSSSSSPFDHAIWASTGDFNIGQQGMSDVTSPPWKFRQSANNASPIVTGEALASAVWYIVTTVWNGTSSFTRTNGVDYVSGSMGTGAFGLGNHGFDFCMSAGATPYYIMWWGMWPSALSTNDMHSAEAYLENYCKVQGQ